MRVVQLRDVQARSAALEVREAFQESDAALRLCEDGARTCEAALSDWSRLVGSERPDPGMIKLGALWLEEQDQNLRGKELNRSIAQDRLGAARAGHANALAKYECAKNNSAQIAITMANDAEERSSLSLVDTLLWRRPR